MGICSTSSLKNLGELPKNVLAVKVKRKNKIKDNNDDDIPATLKPESTRIIKNVKG
jgi:hypothetical protein